MRNVSEVIEQYLKQILQQSPGGVIEIQRNDLADQFNCVPSQINYVISTRFTLEKGYIVESKRGGGGTFEFRRLNCILMAPCLTIFFERSARIWINPLRKVCCTS